jgi:hypothetical protein
MIPSGFLTNGCRHERLLFHERNKHTRSGPLIHIDESHFQGFRQPVNDDDVDESEEDEVDPTWEYQPLTEQQIVDELKALGWYKEPPVSSPALVVPLEVTPTPPVHPTMKTRRPKTSKQKLPSVVSPKPILSESQIRERIQRICSLRLKLSQFIRQQSDGRSKKPPDPKSSLDFPNYKPPRPPRPPDPPLSSDNTFSLVSVSSSTSSSNLEDQPNTYLTKLNSGADAENMDEVSFLLFFLTLWTILAFSYPDRSWTLWKQELKNHPPPLLHIYTHPLPRRVVCT